MDDNRRQALSRARGIANQQLASGPQRFRLQGVNRGDVLDWHDAGLFLAVTSVTQQGLRAQAVSQADPWSTVREIHMGAYPLYLRINHGWLSKVPPLRM